MVDIHAVAVTPQVAREASTIAPSSTERRHDLDALRSFAMLLGIALHAAIPFVPYRNENEFGTRVNGLFFEFVHGFRMPVFFLLSGYFTTMLWSRRGTRAVLRHRVERVGLPLIVGALTIVPLVRWSFSAAHNLVGSSGAAHPIELSHLWFLWFLLLMVAAFGAVVATIDAITIRRPRLGTLREPLARLSLFALPALTIVPASRMVEPIFGPDYSDTIIPNDGVLAYYGCFFAFGALAFGRTLAGGTSLLDTLGRRWVGLLATGSLLFFPLGNRLMTESPLTSSLLQVSFAWVMSFGLLGAFTAVASRRNNAIAWLSDASYWMYLVHLPLVILAQALASRAGLSPLVAAPVIFATTTPVLMISYQRLVRFTRIGTALNGPRIR